MWYKFKHASIVMGVITEERPIPTRLVERMNLRSIPTQFGRFVRPPVDSWLLTILTQLCPAQVITERAFR